MKSTYFCREFDALQKSLMWFFVKPTGSKDIRGQSSIYSQIRRILKISVKSLYVLSLNIQYQFFRQNRNIMTPPGHNDNGHSEINSLKHFFLYFIFEN